VQKAIKSMKFHQLMAPCVSTSVHTHKNKLAFCWAAHLSFLSLQRMSCFLSDKIFLPLPRVKERAKLGGNILGADKKWIVVTPIIPAWIPQKYFQRTRPEHL